MKAANCSGRTVETYLEGLGQLDAFLAKRNITELADVDRKQVTDFVAELTETRSAATASNRYRALRSFFAWLMDEEEVERSPMEKMKPPKVPVTPVLVLSEGQIKALLGACSGGTFEDRRDEAIIRLLADAGLRRAERLGMKVEDLDLDQQVAFVLGKGRGSTRSGNSSACPRPSRPPFPRGALVGEGGSPSPPWRLGADLRFSGDSHKREVECRNFHFLGAAGFIVAVYGLVS